MIDLNNVFSKMEEAILEANNEIMRLYNSHLYNVKIKEDSSPVTTADYNSNKIIHSKLDKFDDIAFLSEEDSDNKNRLNHDYVFIVDPLDGTSDFVNRDGSFSINLALVYKGDPIISFVGLPALSGYCYAIKDKGTYEVINGIKKQIFCSKKTSDLILVESMTHASEKEKEIVIKNKDRISSVIKAGASTKAYYIASQKADVSIRFTSMTKEWDTCACELIIKEAGGYFTDTYLKSFKYNKEDVFNHDGYCMFNCKDNFTLLK